ncbi:YciI family protein [Actinacidiphila rubida]
MGEGPGKGARTKGWTAWRSTWSSSTATRSAGTACRRRKAGGAVLASGELEPATTATSLRAGSGGRPAITDGPFLESKEVLGGFYLLEARDLDEAIALSGGLAEVAHDHSGVEVRPLVRH